MGRTQAIFDFSLFGALILQFWRNFLQNYAKIGRAQQMRGLRPRQSWGRCPQTPAGGSAPWTPVTRSQGAPGPPGRKV